MLAGKSMQLIESTGKVSNATSHVRLLTMGSCGGFLKCTKFKSCDFFSFVYVDETS